MPASDAAAPNEVRVAVLGGGTVGSEVVRALVRGDPHLAGGPGGPLLRLVGVAVRDLGRARARGLPEDLLTDAPAHLVAADDVDIVVELLGGDEPARTLVASALGAGRPVVTANKHVVAHHGPELEAIARRTNAPFRFEAAVGGGIPVLSPLAADLAANRIRRLRGIVNGTTNYILSEMATGRRTYESVLAEAQAAGYAEADPSGDVEGDDAVNKLVILARLAFGVWVDPRRVPRRAPALRGDAPPGIIGVTADELAGAAACGFAIRLIASAGRGDGDTAPRLSVRPTAMPAETPLGRTAGIRNRLEFEAEPLGWVGFDGPGAGGAATSSAVLGDLLAIVRGEGSTWAALAPPATAGSAATTDSSATSDEEVDRRWFVHLPGLRRTKAVDAIAERQADAPGGTAVLTRPCRLAEIRARLLGATPESLRTTLYPVDA